MFIEILEISGEVEKTKYIEDAKKVCKKFGRLREFESLLKAWMKMNNKVQTGDKKVTTFTGAKLILNCGKYIADDTGVRKNETGGNGDLVTTVACPHPILPVERLVNMENDMEKVKLEYYKDGRWKSAVVSCNTIFNRSKICELADRGVLVTSESAKDLVKYLADVISLNYGVIPLYRSISRLGWINGDFAPYVQDIKYDGDMDFQNIYEQVGERGSYETWLEHVGQLRSNINIRLMLDTSFASVLIEKVGALPFITHLWGTTGFGKTVSLMVASSIWGNPEMGCLTRTMNMTANSMARTSAFLYSIPFCADELQQIKDNWKGNYDNLVMYLTEGIDRGRAKAHGGVEELRTWRNSFLFTGEEPVTKSTSGGGVKNRVIEIEVKDKIIQDGNKTANLVKENYGYAGKRFVEFIQSVGEESIRRDYKAIYAGILNACETTEKQAMSMSLILLADMYSCEAIFCDSSPLSVLDVKEYMASEKCVDMAERAFEYIVNWIAENQIRFTDTTDENRGAVWGKIEDGVAIVNKNAFTKALNEAGYDYAACARRWADDGRILRNTQGRYVHQTAVYGIKASYIKVVMEELQEETGGENPFDAEISYKQITM